MSESRVEQISALQALSRTIRQHDLRMIQHAGIGHVGGDFSAIDILVTLYFGVLHIDPQHPDDAERDRFILSKGHAAGSLYTTLAHAGFFPLGELQTFAQPLSRLNGHPNRLKVPGVEANTGPLGHGLPIAVGNALAAKMDGKSWRTYVLTGDGELQEGSNWEAIMAAAHYGLANLTAIVDRNGLQQGDRTEHTMHLEPLADKWRAFGWTVYEVDGHSHAQLLDVFELASAQSERPCCIIAHTSKGQGVSFMRNRVEWHHRVPTEDEAALALQELDEIKW
jgi:transketolase